MTGFQSVINIQPAPAQAGDFASANPRASLLHGAGAFVVGPNGLSVGGFAWADPTMTYIESDAAISGGVLAPVGFVHRGSNEAQIVQYLSETSLIVPAGMGCSIHNAGDFWVVSSTVSSYGQKVFANLNTGLACTGAAGATIANFVETKWWCYSIQAAGELIKMSHVAPR